MRDEDNADDVGWYQYDAFGRLTHEWRRYDSPFGSNPATTRYTYDDTVEANDPASVRTEQQDDDGSGTATYLESWQFYSVPVLCRPTGWAG